MTIQRTKLIKAILAAEKTSDKDVYVELLKILYRLMEQENINKTFITEFTVYEKISDKALLLIEKATV